MPQRTNCSTLHPSQQMTGEDKETESLSGKCPRELLIISSPLLRNHFSNLIVVMLLTGYQLSHWRTWTIPCHMRQRHASNTQHSSTRRLSFKDSHLREQDKLRGWERIKDLLLDSQLVSIIAESKLLHKNDETDECE